MTKRNRSIPMQLVTRADAQSADLYIMGDIRRNSIFDAWDESGAMAERKTSGLDMVKALSELPDTVGEITVHINSFGGEVAEGLSIYNAIKSHAAHVTTICEGFACSIASVIFMAGDVRVMRDSSLLMIHNPFLQAEGTADDLRHAADGLDVIREASVTAYMAHANVSEEEIKSLMDAETWLTAEMAIDMGLATEVEEDEDDDRPTQGARRSIVDALTALPNSNIATEDALEALVNRIIEHLDERLAPLQAQDEDEDEDDDDDDDEDELKKKAPNQAYQRYARIFQQLAE